MEDSVVCEPTRHKFGFVDIQALQKRDPITGDERTVAAVITVFCRNCGVFRTEKITYADA